MLDRVRDRFLDEPIRRALDVACQARWRASAFEIQVEVRVDLQAVTCGRALSERLERGLDAELVERCGPQFRDQALKRADAHVELLERPLNRSAERLRLTVCARRLKHQLQGTELLKRLVVQLAGPAPALGFGGAHGMLETIRLDRLCGGDRYRRAGAKGSEQVLLIRRECR